MINDRRPPDEMRICPECSHLRSPANRGKKVLSVWVHRSGRENTFCHHCGSRGTGAGGSRIGLRRPTATRKDKSDVAQSLWNISQPAEGTAVVPYLTEARGLGKYLPSTTRYLPASRQRPHAMIAAFGLVEEAEPGVLSVPTIVKAVHRTFLLPDGSGKHRMGKRMLGPVSGKPIVLAPPNDSLGLIITEGIEEALSMHEVTGLGAWAAGSATLMAKLAPAVPNYIECVTIIADSDVTGQKFATMLAEQLRLRGCDVIKKTLKRHGG